MSDLEVDPEHPKLAEQTERMLRKLAKPCIKITSERVSDRPLRRNPFVSLFGGMPAAPVLRVTESKFGGVPYCDPDEAWDANTFLMQIDLAQATSVLPEHVPKLEGLLRVDIGPRNRIRWFRDVDPARHVSARPDCVGAYEARLRFARGWTIPEGEELERLWPLTQPHWHEYERFFPDGYNDDADTEYHRMLGFRGSGLEDSNFLDEQPSKLGLASYEQLLRLPMDVAAAFHWGSSCRYVVVPHDDLRRGDLSRAALCSANS